MILVIKGKNNKEMDIKDIIPLRGKEYVKIVHADDNVG